jgi:protocatechuate 3,4-dioxygenase beta subunit
MKEYHARDHARHPPALTQDYKSTVLRAPKHAPLALGQTISEMTGPRFGRSEIGELDHDLTQNFAKDGGPIGERIILHGRVLDEGERPVPNALIEIWQANAGGRYRHQNDSYLAPLDPNFGGCGRTLTDDAGDYLFRTIKPGAYPWPNWQPSWRPAHIHVSVFGHSFSQRLVTQLYFEGDPLIAICPIANSIPDPRALEQLIAPLDMLTAQPFDCLAYRFNIVLRGRYATPFENRPEGN